MKIYHFDEKGLYLGESEADKSPLEKDVYLIPANATDTKPPTAGINQVAKFDGNQWALIPDFRGIKYWTADHVQHEITEAGQLLPDDFYLNDPPLTQAEIDAKANEQLKAELMQLDLASIRALREYAASQPDAPQIIKDRETAATAKRALLK